MSDAHYSDVLIIGSGAAGLSAALYLSENHKVSVLSKTNLSSGSTYWAQGGIAAVLDETDSVEAHVNDTLIAGAGLCHQTTVEHVVLKSKEAVQWLLSMGVEFSTDTEEEGNLHLTKEGGHSHRRIIHSDDATGKAVSKSLSDRVLESPNIEVFENHIAVDLVKQADYGSAKIRCNGAYVLDLQTDAVRLFQAKTVILATGGASKVYLYSTNPDGASGVAGRLSCCQHGIQSISSNLFVPPTSKIFFNNGSSQR